jgi:S-formylglutathione hydrolase FrmB
MCAHTSLTFCCRSWDFGTGAGFYLDATEDKWRQYRMYSYITQELPTLLRSFPELDVDRVSGRQQREGGCPRAADSAECRLA